DPKLPVFPLTASAIEQTFRRILKRVEIEDFDFNYLRHTATTRLAFVLPESERSYYCGPSVKGITQKVYTHIDQLKMVEMIRPKLDAGYENYPTFGDTENFTKYVYENENGEMGVTWQDPDMLPA